MNQRHDELIKKTEDLIEFLKSKHGNLLVEIANGRIDSEILNELMDEEKMIVLYILRLKFILFKQS